MNVISITDRENMSSNGAARRLSLLQSARDTANKLLGDAFREMLDRADDLLFAFAEKAENNTQQSLYFDAMRELRTKRSPLHRAFVEGMQHGYDRRCQRSMSNRSPSMAAGATALSLMDDATMEQDITVAGLAERIGNIAREELFALNQRIGSLMNIENLSSEDNPLGPSSIVEAVRDAADCLSVELKIRLIVLKLFERHVAALVPAIYGRVNQHLIDKGVLPTLVTQVRRQSMRVPVPASTAVAEISDTAPVNAADMLSMITQLVQPGAVGGGVATMPLVPLNVGTMRTLTELQHQPITAFAGQATPGSKFLVELQRGGVLPQMGPAGDMTIDIVAMLFEYILEDRNLPEEFRVRLARLQIPVLKVALIDREFFSRKGHPARRLLNLIAECGATSVAEPAIAKDLVGVVDKIVQQIITHFEQDIGIFNRAVEALQSAIEKIRRNAALRTARTTRVLDGRAQLERAKEQARNLVDTRLRPEGVPEVVRNFLLSHWKRLLITAICKEGADSEGVRLAIKTMDQLVWSTLPKAGMEDRKKLARMLPDLLAQLKKGMEALSIPQVARSGFLSKLEKAHSDAMRGTVAASPNTHECPAEPATSASVVSEIASQPSVELEPASDDPGGFEMLDITTGEISGDINQLLAAEAARPDAPVEDVPVPVIELDSQPSEPSQPVIAEESVPVRLESTQPDQSEKKTAALRILEEAQSAAERLRARLDSEDEVKLSEVMPPVDTLPVPAPSNPVNALLDITANTFIKIFSQSPEAQGEASQGLEFEELTLGDTRHPALPNPEDQYLEQVKNLKPGTWLELKREDGSTIQARFARYSEETASFNFTDKAGRLVVERTLQGLVADFRRGSIRELAEPPGAMDRAFTRLLDPSTWRNRNR